MNDQVTLLSTGTLKGTEVKNPAGENLGHLEEIMLDLDSGRVSYTVLSFGGILGIGDKLFAVPWQALAVDQQDEKLVLDVDKERLKEAPGFDKDHWPHTANPTWLGEVYKYYGYTYRA